MAMKQQTAFGWKIAAGLFFGGAGAGVFLASFTLDILNKYEPVARIGAVLGPVLLLACSAFFMSDLGSKSRVYKLISNPSSWMSRGAAILTGSILFGLGYSLPSFGLFAWLPWDKSTALGEAIGIVAALFSLLAVLYTGFLLGVAKPIPFWNTPVLPLLFLFSGLDTGLAILELVAVSLPATLGQGMAAALHQLGIAEIILITLQLLVLAGYLEIARHRGTSAAESVRLLKTPLFTVGVMAIGLVVPLCLLLFSALTGGLFTLYVSAIIAGILLLVGGILLRYTILRAGVYLPSYSV